MDERCIGCPWFDEERQECTRTPPRFCEVDRSIPPPEAEVKASLPTASQTQEPKDR